MAVGTITVIIDEKTAIFIATKRTLSYYNHTDHDTKILYF